MHSCKFTYLMKFLEGVFVIDITASADQEQLIAEVRDLRLEAFVAYLVARNLVAVANPTVVAIVQAEIESVASIAVVEAVSVTAALEMVTNLMHFVEIVVEFEPVIVVARVQSAGLFAYLSCQIEVLRLAVAVTQGHYYPTVDAYLIGCFADLSIVAVAVAGWRDCSVVQVTSVVAANH
ncbi:hypothetical protein LR48_Vigan05g223200 [Vigna angularis]|uniref:Uncharacterized protein n=1 Tax=Phaseolus angularis TaxID=3914 RepID=A0A0L9UPX0_PHAAN|nr:hypothetical protein LR48_Vigan05g223200 [Vigna angularis]